MKNNEIEFETTDEQDDAPIEHTPTPWAVTWHRDDNNFVSYMVNEEDIAGSESDIEAESNAAYIVRAVNAHEELVSLLKEFVYGPANAEKRKRGMQALAKAEGK